LATPATPVALATTAGKRGHVASRRGGAAYGGERLADSVPDEPLFSDFIPSRDDQGRSMAHSILVVDNDHTLVELLVELFDEEGYRVRYAFDGVTALQEITQHAPDLVLADVMMPRVDGFSLLRRLRLVGCTMPVVLMSAVYSAVDEPGTTVMRKPFDLDTVLAVVNHALAGGRP
jgi:CheY-like chemotaxis protein